MATLTQFLINKKVIQLYLLKKEMLSMKAFSPGVIKKLRIILLIVHFENISRRD